MGDNKLFNFIKNHLTINQAIGSSILKEDTHTNGTGYYRFELPQFSPIKLSPFILISQHLSVYEKSMNKIDLLSEYHYTAYFENAKGIQYRLHIYFDCNDNLVGEPQLTIINPDNTIAESIALPTLPDLVSFAMAYQFPLITLIRQQQFQKINELDSITQALDREATHLSMMLDIESNAINKENFGHKIQALILANETLQVLSYQKSIKGTITFLKKMTQSLETLDIVPPQQPKLESNAKKQKPSKEESKRFNHPARHHTILSQITNQNHLNATVAALQNKFQNLDSKNHSNESLSTLLSIYNGVKEVRDTLTFSSNEYSTNSFHAMIRLEEKINTYGKKILTRYLLLNEFDNADKLKIFFPITLTNDLFNTALAQLNEPLLTFLIKNNSYNIDTFQPKFKNNQYNSIIEYLLVSLKNPENTQKLINCLSLLLKQGLSLLNKDTNGLPYLFTLLDEDAHPLRESLEKNRQLILDNSHVLTQLIYQLESHSLPDNNPLKVRINKMIDKIHSELELINAFQASNILKNIDRHGEYRTACELFSAKVIKDIKEDSEIQSLTQELSHLVAEIVPRLPHTEQRAITVNWKINFNKLKSYVDSLDDCLPVEFDTIRQPLINQLNDYIKYWKLRNELLELTTQNPQPLVLFQGKSNSKRLKIHNKKCALSTEINQLYEKINKGDEITNQILEKNHYALSHENLIELENDISHIQERITDLKDFMESLNQLKKTIHDTLKYDDHPLETISRENNNNNNNSERPSSQLKVINLLKELGLFSRNEMSQINTTDLLKELTEDENIALKKNN